MENLDCMKKYPFDQKSLWNEWQTFIYADQPLQDVQGGGVGGHHQAEPLQVKDEDVLRHLDIQRDSSQFISSLTPQFYLIFWIKLAFLTFNARFSHKRFNATKRAHKFGNNHHKRATVVWFYICNNNTSHRNNGGYSYHVYHTGLLSSLVFCLI